MIIDDYRETNAFKMISVGDSFYEKLFPPAGEELRHFRC